MQWISSLIHNVTEIFKWFFILQPWEQGIRVRAGKNIKKFHGGMHFKIPFIDTVYKQNMRTRIAGIKPVNCTTTDGKTVTVAGALEYSISDIEPLYQRLHNAEDTIGQYVGAILTQYICTSDSLSCTPQKVMDHVTETMDLSKWGLSPGNFLLTDFVFAKTYRVITGEIHKWFADGLDTVRSDDSTKDHYV